MKFRIISVLAISGLLSLTACLQDHPNSLDEKKEIKVSATIDGANNTSLKSRATNSTWEDSDAIGIFMKKAGVDLSPSALAGNAKYVTDGTGKFSPTPSNQISFLFFHRL